MSRHEKALQRIAAIPKDFRWPELVTLMEGLGYVLLKSGGSRRKFKNIETGRQFAMHEPHPSGILKAYQVRGIIEFLTLEGHL